MIGITGIPPLRHVCSVVSQSCDTSHIFSDLIQKEDHMGRKRNTLSQIGDGASVRALALLICFLTLCGLSGLLAGCSGGSVGKPLLAVAQMTPSSVTTSGGQVAFAGTSFTPDMKITFGGVAATKVYYQSPTLVTALVPAASSTGAVDVVVSTSDGQSVKMASALTYTAPSTPPATTCNNLPCTYSAVDPSNTLLGNAAPAQCAGCPGGQKLGSLGYGSGVIFNKVYAPADGTYTLTITGCEGAGTQNYGVSVNGGAVQLVPLSGSDWYSAAPPVAVSIPLKAGAVNTIEFNNPNDWMPDIVSIKISAINGATLPTITSVSPASLPITGGSVTVTGTNFASDMKVTVGANPVSSVNIVSSTQFTMQAPPSSVTGPVDITLSSQLNGNATIKGALTYTELQACTSSTCTYLAWDPQNTLNGGAKVASCVGCQYGLKVGSMGYGNGVTFNNVFAPADGNYIVSLVGCEGGGTQFYQVTANGSSTPVSVPLYGNNWYLATPPVQAVVALKQGSANTITVTNNSTWSPDIVSISVSPGATSQAASQPITMTSGQNTVIYDLGSGLASYSQGGTVRIADFFSQAYVGPAVYRSTSSSYTRAATTVSPNETDITLTATDGSPTMIQRFIVTDKHFTVQLELDNANGGSNQMAPVVVNGSGAVDVGANADPRFLIVPFDNNAYYNYNAESSNGASDTSYEVGAFYDNTSRNGLVIGSVTHDTWRTGIGFTGNANKLDLLWAYGGANSTEDQLPHGTVSGAKILSPVILVGYYDDWRDGMEDFANVNAQYAPMLAWNGPAPMGWNSWGKIQNNINYTNATAVEDYFANSLPNFKNNGVVYINLDSYWSNLSDSELASYVSHAHSQGQKAGIYWSPFIIWNWTDLTQPVDGAAQYKFGDIVMRNPDGTVMNAVNSGWGADPTHPGTLARIDYYIDKFKQLGFDYIKLDFLPYGDLEGGSNNGKFHDATVQTGTQAYSVAMRRIVQDINGSMLIDESIAPIFPYQFAHTRRVAGDTYGSIEDTKREMASASFGWWLAGRLYNWNDPDGLLLGGTETPSGSSTPFAFTANENKSRVTSGAVAGFMLNSDDLTDPNAQALAQKYLTNSDINSMPGLGLNFRPVEANTGTAPANVLVASKNGVYYIAVFNYDGSNPLNTTIDLGRAGLNSTTTYTVTDLWSGASSHATGSLSVNLGAAESTLLKLQ